MDGQAGIGMDRGELWAQLGVGNQGQVGICGNWQGYEGIGGDWRGWGGDNWGQVGIGGDGEGQVVIGSVSLGLQGDREPLSLSLSLSLSLIYILLLLFLLLFIFSLLLSNTGAESDLELMRSSELEKIKFPFYNERNHLQSNKKQNNQQGACSHVITKGSISRVTKKQTITRGKQN